MVRFVAFYKSVFDEFRFTNRLLPYLNLGSVSFYKFFGFVRHPYTNCSTFSKYFLKKILSRSLTMGCVGNKR